MGGFAVGRGMTDFVILTHLLLITLTPWLLCVCAAVVQLTVQRRLQRSPMERLDRTAKRWLEDTLPHWAPETTLLVHDEGIDGYYPAASCISLTHETAASLHPLQRVIAAHELGHAMTCRRLGAHAWTLALARLIAPPLSIAFTGTLLAGALLHASWLLSLSGVLAVLAVGVHLVIVLDEATASRQALTVLRRSAFMRPYLAGARLALGSALSVYGAALLGRMILVACWPAILSVAYAGLPPTAAVVPNVPAVWLLVFLLPLLSLHAAWVLRQIWRPEPIQSGFRLAMNAQRDGQWDFSSGFGVLLLVIGLYDHATGPLFEAAIALATLVALPAGAAVLQLGIIGPFWMLSRFLSPRPVKPSWMGYVSLQAQREPLALMALYSEPPWYLRASWILRLCYVPLIAHLCWTLLMG